MKIRSSRTPLPTVKAQRSAYPVQENYGFGDGPFGMIPMGGQDAGPYGPEATREGIVQVIVQRLPVARVFAYRTCKEDM